MLSKLKRMVASFTAIFMRSPIIARIGVEDPGALIKKIRAAGMRVGIALKPGTGQVIP